MGCVYGFAGAEAISRANCLKIVHTALIINP